MLSSGIYILGYTGNGDYDDKEDGKKVYSFSKLF